MAVDEIASLRDGLGKVEVTLDLCTDQDPPELYLNIHVLGQHSEYTIPLPPGEAEKYCEMVAKNQDVALSASQLPVDNQPED